MRDTGWEDRIVMPSFLWTQRQDVGPAARWGAAVAFDAGAGRIVLFGGRAGDNDFNDTWLWDGSHWTQYADIGPASRSGCALAFDSVRGRTVLFGGVSGTTALADTWEWDGGAWTQLADTGPSARDGHRMAFDVSRQRTVLFGGRPLGVTDTWEWDGTEWTQYDDIGPSPRALSALAYATDRQRTVLFGGITADGAALRDTWEWDGTHWLQVDDTGPAARAGAAAAFAGSSIVLFGGMSGSEANTRAAFADTWSWDGSHWTQRQDMGPSARWRHALSCDTTRGRFVLFGGSTTPAVSDQLADTWEAPTDSTGLPGGGAGAIIEFHIPVGTSSGPWNTQASPVRAHVGDVLRVINQDTDPHQLHSSGPPMPHWPTPLLPGQAVDHVLSAPYDDVKDPPLYDHLYGMQARFWLVVDPAA